MSWFKETISSSIGRKLVMALTGIFLILFLAEHLIGNLLLLKGDSGVAFNEYAHFMKHNVFIQIGEVILFGGILFHVIEGIVLMIKYKKARPVGYTTNKSKINNWTSRFMGPFGVIILVFLIIHLNNFFRYKYFPGSEVSNMEGTDVMDMAGLVYRVFANPLEVTFYVVAMMIVGFHLWHGFESSFQTLGLNNKKYTPLIRIAGRCFAVLVPLGLALIPLVIYIRG